MTATTERLDAYIAKAEITPLRNDDAFYALILEGLALFNESIAELTDELVASCPMVKPWKIGDPAPRLALRAPIIAFLTERARRRKLGRDQRWSERLSEFIAEAESMNIDDRTAFSALVRRGCAVTCTSDRILACQLEVAPRTINRWRNGRTAPARLMRTRVIDCLIDYAKQRLQELP